MIEKIATLVPGKSDAEIASDFRYRFIEVHKPILELLGEIDRAGFEVSSQIGKNGLGEMALNVLKIVKVYV